MGHFRQDEGRFVIERRAARRTRATCAASLRTLTKESVGYLWDLSQTGARVSFENPPQIEDAGLLRWGTQKVMCHVIWIDRDMCGLTFDCPIDSEIVASGARMIGIVAQPKAAISNIEAGHKRSPLGQSKPDAADRIGSRPN